MILSFGEILLRLAPDENATWLSNTAMHIYPGGAELNVATALSKWKVPVSYCTAVPDNFLSAQLIKYIEAQKIDTSTILYHGKKIGLYYLLEGKDMQQTDIIYDRTYSSFYDLKPGMINWEEALQGIRWFHFSAISASLNENVAAVCEEALKACARKGITVSVDLNHRQKLWQYGKSSNEVIPELIQYCDIVMGNLWSIEAMLKIKLPANINEINTKENYLAQAKKTAETIVKEFPKCKIVANTFRFRKNDMECYGSVYANNSFYSSATYKTHTVIDKTGSSDSFMAGLIYGVYNHLPFQQLINFATGAAFQKLFIKGDCIDKTVDEIKSFILHYN